MGDEEDAVGSEEQELAQAAGTKHENNQESARTWYTRWLGQGQNGSVGGGPEAVAPDCEPWLEEDEGGDEGIVARRRGKVSGKDGCLRF